MQSRTADVTRRPGRQSAPQPTPVAQSGTPRRILVIDDDPNIRHVLSKRLSFDGFEHKTCGSAEEGLATYLDAHCRQVPFDAIVLDMCLGSMRGRDLLALIRNSDERCAVLMISGESSIESAIECIELGADDYLCKPIKVWDLKDRLATALTRRRTIFTRRPELAGLGLRFGELTENARKSRAGDEKDAAENNTHSHGGSRTEGIETGVLARKPEGEMGAAACDADRELGRIRESGTPSKISSEKLVSQAHSASDRPSRPITPPGALIHMASRLEVVHGSHDDGHRVATALSRLAAFVASELQLQPSDLDGLVYAARVRNLVLARTRASTHRSFTCRFVRAVSKLAQNDDRCLCAAAILEATEDPITQHTASPKTLTLAALLTATVDHIASQDRGEDDYIAHPATYERARKILSSLC